MLKRLIEGELHLYDVKAYDLPAADEKGLKEVFLAMKRTVLAHDLRLVREREGGHDGTHEAWFYGETKVTQDKFVIRAAVDVAKARAEFYAASSSMTKVTGLLAELNRNFFDEASQLDDTEIRPQHDRDSRAAYADVGVVWSMIEPATP